MAAEVGENGKPTVPQSRKLTAILAADIAGYSALMGTNEARTVADLKSHQAVVFPMVAEFEGRIIDTAGDGIFAEFASVVKAVECALAIQKTMAERNAAVEPERRMRFRIGINFGDVIVEESRIFGDGVNVAARVEKVADPGGICVSARVQEETTGRLNIRFEDLGEHQLKNITRPQRLFRVLTDLPTATKANVDAETTLAFGHPRRLARLLDRLHTAYRLRARNGSSTTVATSHLWQLIGFPLLIIIVAHHLIVNSFSLNTLYLRIASILIPLPFGIVLGWRTRVRSSFALAIGAILGVLGTAAMTTSEGLNSGEPIMPSTIEEWRENFEYAVTIALAFFVGSLIGSVISALGSKNRIQS
jgi:class 3 adenylate cyclase